MFKKKSLFIVTIIAFLLPVNAYTKELSKEKGKFSIGIKTGHLGGGLDVSYDYTNKISFRSNLNKFNGSDPNAIFGNVAYNMNSNDNTFGLIVDYYPMGRNQAVRTSLGFYKHQGSFTFNALKDGNNRNKNIGGTSYDIKSTSLKGTTMFNSITPYLGVAMDFVGKNWGVTPEIGIFLRDINPEVKLSDISNTIKGSDLRNEEKKISDDFKHGILFFGIGVSYHF
jgi:hypothetical protein